MKYINLVKGFLAFWILTKIKTFFYWQDDTMHAYKSLYLQHCGPSTEILSKSKSIDEKEDS